MSTCNISTTFKQVSQVGNTLLNSQLESNLKSFIDWGMLGIGGWFNITIPSSGAWGGTFDQLRVVDDPSYTLGQVWETPRKDWVWETGVAYIGSSPIDISGVYIDDTLKGTGDATYGHHYNYPLGQLSSIWQIRKVALLTTINYCFLINMRTVFPLQF